MMCEAFHALLLFMTRMCFLARKHTFEGEMRGDGRALLTFGLVLAKVAFHSCFWSWFD